MALWPFAGKELSPLAFYLCCFYFSAVLVVRVPFPFVVWDRVWNSIVSVLDHCLLMYFGNSLSPYHGRVQHLHLGIFSLWQFYPSELQLNKANSSDTEAPFLDLHLTISDGFVSSKIYDKRDDFDFDIVNFPFSDGDMPRATSYGVYISQLIRFAKVSTHVGDFDNRN